MATFELQTEQKDIIWDNLDTTRWDDLPYQQMDDKEYFIYAALIGEQVAILEVKGNALQKDISESIGLAETEADPSDYRRYYYETVNIHEAVSKHLSKALSEGFKIRDFSVLPFASGIISDMGFLNTQIDGDDADDLTAVSRPIGFSEWMRFIDGEYVHKEALFRLRVTNVDAGTIKDVAVTAHKIVCDVYDVMESGAAALSGVSTRVYFSKLFHEVPVVAITSVNTVSFAIPEILAVTQTYFDAWFKTIDGLPADGTISYQAHGY